MNALTFKQLAHQMQTDPNYRPCVVFDGADHNISQIENFESVIDRLMRARIVCVDPHPQVLADISGLVKLIFDLSEFDEYNRAFEKANYYDRYGHPTLTARKAGFYPKDGRESIYFGEDDLVADYFQLIDDPRSNSNVAKDVVTNFMEITGHITHDQAAQSILTELIENALKHK